MEASKRSAEHTKPAATRFPMTAKLKLGMNTKRVMLTGMGADGLEGTNALTSNGCSMIVQDEATSVVWGMPGVVAKAGLATEILPIDHIGSRIAQLVKVRSAREPNAKVGAGSPA